MRSEFESPDSNAIWFEAGFDGECSRDGCIITEGDTIRADGEGGWEKQECVEYDEHLSDATYPISKRDERVYRGASQEEIEPNSDDELPGMWSNSDLAGGWADND